LRRFGDAPPGVVRQVDQFGGFAHSAKDRFGHGFRFPGKRDDRAVVIRVALTVEHQDARHAAHWSSDGASTLDVSRAFENWHAFAACRASWCSTVRRADHNRSVVTLAGEPESRAEAVLRGVGKAAEL